MSAPGWLDRLCVRVQTGAREGDVLLRTTLDLPRTRWVEELDPSVLGAGGAAWRRVHAQAVELALSTLGELAVVAAAREAPVVQVKGRAVEPSRFPLLSVGAADG